ncbi:MAG: polysaccharide biosynthesis C-terminal domain-containing protein, partial [Bacteroidales bacterium]|nr:polysaccharide biosynthesis C-terminal domain-containing protein [Bacteroidales bacterium]
AEIFMGIYSNLSFWYKLTDQTWWGAIISAVSVAAMIAINVIFVPKFGYWACAWGGFAGYGIAMLLSYFLGRNRYPVSYDMRTMGTFVVIAVVLYYFSVEFAAWVESQWLSMVFNTALLGSYALFVWREIKPVLKSGK